jgi:hypothetical protein
LEIVEDVVRTFLKEAASTVLLPDLLYSGGDSNHDISSLFHHFHVFFIFHSYFDEICLNYQHCLLPKHIIDQQFYLSQLLAALAHVVAKMLASVIARTGGGGGI